MKNLIYIFCLFLFVSCGNVEQEKEKIDVSKEIISDDTIKNVYSEVTIGKQIWMSENLKEKKFLNGDEIRQADSFAEWESACKRQESAWCYNEFKEGNDILYNWFAINDDRGIAPKEYRMSTLKDWKILAETIEPDFKSVEKYIEENNYDKMQELQNKVAIALASEKGWFEVHKNNNSSKFNAFPFGHLSSENTFKMKSVSTTFWTKEGGTIFLGNDGGFIFSINTDNYYTEWNEGYSVRCLKK